MKTILGVAGFLILLALVYWGGAEWAMSHRPVSEKTFQQKMDSLSEVTKRLENNQDTIKSNIDSLKSNVDTLKLGQRIIFDEVKKTSDKSFWDMFKF